ncbi:BTB/POZ domain-containing protein KCTD19 isoform X3 [Hemicordylus capensis]|uniref:BTB/POZ domain-containing protein KCTD19 isoform X3 n=1 Tax=Hemicordylus capensis TaxID=884348 RepID=UPI00230423CE|nr:BTB/POZ domain-containing protein KCTD19 isoform X3 [Hemicordylus capensis]
MEEPEIVQDSPEEELVHLNVGGWCFSIPQSKIARFPDSLLWKEVSALTQKESPRLFLDRDGYTFRHVHYFLHTSKLYFSSCAELNLLYEQALCLQLTPLLQTLDNLKEGKHNLRVRPADIPIAERASMNYWRTRKCISKPSEFPLKSPAFTGLHEKAPLGLMDTPLLDTEEEVHYCFLPLDLVEKHPSLVNDDNLLWLSDNAALVECEGSEFRFIANFLRSEKILLPDNFSSMDVLEAEADVLGIPELTEALKSYRSNPGVYSAMTTDLQSPVKSTVPKQPRPPPNAPLVAATGLPLYPMVLGLLVKYPDSALGQLHLEGTLDGNKLHISGNGVLFQHVMNWLGTCKLPLIRNMSELPELCAYLDQMDIIYEPMKEALKTYLKQKTATDAAAAAAAAGTDADWAAEVMAFPRHHIVKVYVGSHWYATYLQTLLKVPELLSNYNKVSWIAYGQSLLINGDGQMFRHILNFLRLDKLFLPSEFKEWPLLCQEVTEYQIPSLMEALCQYETYRLWVKQQETHSEAFLFRSLKTTALEKEQESSEDPREHSYLAIDFKPCASNWTVSREAQAVEGSGRENEKYTRISPSKAAKRRNSWEGSNPSTEGWGNACCYKQPESPPRKRVAKGHLPKKPESRDTPIQKLISLVQGWDMVNSKRHEGQKPSAASRGGSSTDGEPGDRKASCKPPAAPCFGVTCSEHSGTGLVIHAASRGPGSLAKAGQPTLGIPAARGWLAKAGTLEEGPPRGGGFAARELRGQKEEGTCPGQARAIPAEPPDNVGLILKVEHPPVVACDGSCTSHGDSILYSTRLEEVKLATGPAPPAAAKEIVFLSFPLSQEEIFYARKCHRFLTDVILDSRRQKDPKETTARVELLVQRLWSLQITAREFVADLLDAGPFKADSHAGEKLLKWVEFTLPFAWKYSSCMDLLIKRGYFKSLSHFVTGKSVHKPQ